MQQLHIGVESFPSASVLYTKSYIHWNSRPEKVPIYNSCAYRYTTTIPSKTTYKNIQDPFTVCGVFGDSICASIL